MVRPRDRVSRSDPKAGDDLERKVSFTAREVKLVAESERCFRIPRALDDPPSGIGGIGERHIWYGLNEERASEFRRLLGAYIDAPELTLTPQKAVESRQRRISERLERREAYRQFIRINGYRCEACEWSIEDDEREVWGSSFELHHFVPFHELGEGETRAVRAEDFAVLCTSCHRAIHRTEHVSDVQAFAATCLRA